MRAWLQGGLLAVLVFGVSWGGAVAYWRSSNRLPSPTDLLMYMLVLPLALIGLVWFVRKMVRAAGAAPVPAAAASAAPAAVEAPSAIPALAMVAAALRTAHGNAPDEVAEALAQNTARGALDPDLTDDDGYPIMSARTDIDTSAFDDEFTQWRESGTLADPEFSDEQRRALTLATAVLTELAASASAHAALHDQDRYGPVPMLQLLPVLGTDWNEAQRRSASLWLRHTTAQSGWPDQRISAMVPAAGQLSAAAIAPLARHAATSGEPLVAIVLACGSHIGEQSVREWAAAGTLFTAANQLGAVPGEAAAGLLLADARQAALIEAGPHPLLRCTVGAHATASRQKGKPDATVLTTLGTQLCTGSAVDPAGIGMIVSDCDYRNGPVMEVMALAAGATPQLDTATDVQHAGLASGSCGPAGYLASLVLARHHAIELDKPVLCVGTGEPLHRSAALVTPPLMTPASLTPSLLTPATAPSSVSSAPAGATAVPSGVPSLTTES